MKIKFAVAGLLCTLSLISTSCSKDEKSEWVDNTGKDNTADTGNEPGDDKPTQTTYNEQYRPQVHYSPYANWMNDPNGMVYLDGTWHLYYQYNPYGNDWGNMSWGHATSTDLMHWTEQPVAITRCEQGDIFSGSCVIDRDNTAGFGANAMVAIYTASGARQQQNIAYSTDGGKTFTQYSGNPVIANTTRGDFRDPKVFWDEQSQQWVMSLALGWEKKIEFWGSKNLKDWQMLSQFSTPQHAGCNIGQWECPDLLLIDHSATANGQSSMVNGQWILIVSVNPGGPNGGSGTMYFVGDWDGKEFHLLEQDYPLWLDSGADNYAGVTFCNAPSPTHESGAGRWITIGWMNNWNYAGASPVKPWRSAMTLPREFTLKEIDGKVLLCSNVVTEIDKIAGEWAAIEEGDFASRLSGNVCSQLHVEIPVLTSGSIILSNDADEKYEIKINKGAALLMTARDKNTGDVSFNGSFSLPSVKSTLYSTDRLALDIFIDQSSVEIFSDDGSVVQTNTVYPRKAYHRVTLSGLDVTMKVRPLKSIWQ